MLPNEAQWEKAARGPAEGDNPGRIYPWGELANPNCMNFTETKIGTTSAVGCFPDGASPYKIEDLNGNVWEWTRTQWQDNYKKDYQPDLSVKDSAVLRGGSFDIDERLVRCSSRVLINPHSRGNVGGFRVVCGVPH